MSQNPAVAPEYFDEFSKREWQTNTERYGNPVYKRPFWFWENSLADPAYVNRCSPFQLRTSSNKILACAVWNNKEPGDFWFATSPLFMDDYRANSAKSPASQSPDIIIDADLPDVDGKPQEFMIDDVPVSPKDYGYYKAAEKQAAVMRRNNQILLLLVGVTALGVGVRYYEMKQQRKRR